MQTNQCKQADNKTHVCATGLESAFWHSRPWPKILYTYVGKRSSQDMTARQNTVTPANVLPSGKKQCPVYVITQGRIQGGPGGLGPPWPPKMRPQHQNSTKLRPQNGSFRPVMIWGPPLIKSWIRPWLLYRIYV